MTIEIDPFSNQFDSQFKLFHELMAQKVHEILLVSTPYDAWVMEEDCRLSERIINEYRGLNLSHPPKLTWVSTAEEALNLLDSHRFDMVITMPRLADMDAFALAQKIKQKVPGLPVILLSHSALLSSSSNNLYKESKNIDGSFVWSGNTDILVALIKSTEDKMNVDRDTLSAGIRVIIYVEDSPIHISSMLPILYKEIVSQTQAVLEEGINEEHRLLTMRARPKILTTNNYEDAMKYFDRYEPYILGVISDVKFFRDGSVNHTSGPDFLKYVKKKRFDIPLLLVSSDKKYENEAMKIPSAFISKNSPTMYKEVRSFLREYLGFGDFIFRMPDGREIARSSNMRTLEKCLQLIPDESFTFHSMKNNFSRWLFARTEITLASKLRPLTQKDFENIDSYRQYLISAIESRRRRRQKGVIVNFDATDFDLDTEFFKIGNGSIGGKARGLAFVASLLKNNSKLHKSFREVNIFIPQTLVITTEGFETFVNENNLHYLSKINIPDEKIAERFLDGQFPQWIERDLRAYLSKVRYPLAIRSSSLLEDAQFHSYAGLYGTYMISNDHEDIDSRLKHLIEAIKLVYASTYFKGPKSFSRRVGHRTEEEQMAVILQQLVGEQYKDAFYPAISGVAQSHNYYPFGHMKPEDGIATIAFGLGKSVVEGERTMRFSPKYPQLLPHYSSVEDILENTQRQYYSLSMEKICHPLSIDDSNHLKKKNIMDAMDEMPLHLLASTYIPGEHSIRDSALSSGYKVMTFAPILKFNQLPLAGILSEALKMGEIGMGCPVELEFSVNLCKTHDTSECKPEFAFLQLRPMTARAELARVEITKEEIEKAFCYSTHALGNTINNEMMDIIFVRPNRLDSSKTATIAQHIGKINLEMVQKNRKYLLIGPGRWGSADRWLGIPVAWEDISGVCAVVETSSDALRAEPSQGSHFFHNITTLGINYITVKDNCDDFIRWDWVQSQTIVSQTEFVSHVALSAPILLKVDGSKTIGVIYV